MTYKENIVTLALIGKGAWGSNYITTINSLDCCQLPPEYIKTRDYPELFEHPNIGGIIIATPTSTHFTIANECILAGYNVLIEKPVTKTLDEALELGRILQEHQSIVMVGHLLLYNPGYIELKKHLPVVGSITHLYFSGLKSPIRTDATPIEDWLPHPLYLFVDLIGQEPIEISAKQVSKDIFHVDVKFPNEIPASIDIGWTWPEKKRELIVRGTKGTLTLDSDQQVKTLILKGVNGQDQKFEIPTSHSPLALEVLEFVECIKTGRKPKTGLDQGIAVMRIIEQANESLNFSAL